MRHFLHRFLLPLLMRVLYATLRKSFVLPVELPHGKVLVAFWHGKMLTGWLAARSVLRTLNAGPIYAVVSLSKDGEILAQALATLGFHLIRGSSSRGKEQVRAAIQSALREGAAVVITPDGPRGPSRRFKYGSLRLAAMHQAPLLFLAITHRSKWTLRSWDAFEIPKPFSKVELTAHCIEVPAFETEDALQHFAHQLSTQFA
ncbi:MAG: DUF374 domain-containing protein [Chloroherpetonaceae bacterium]|nr:DUF374 domain-containing protein [Chloroherpetonaceae bacterium]MCS7211093.1 DUF374 domain-containing protein [Chloroherpetonaceae bacterium]MDW8018900.1 DUF374 domain-containing protein [Chloroherpetonaceae bacterium]MDW8467573.1 DUF374 domain-containing protein [Chloroherpetonaceae bacterium]